MRLGCLLLLCNSPLHALGSEAEVSPDGGAAVKDPLRGHMKPLGPELFNKPGVPIKEYFFTDGPLTPEKFRMEHVNPLQPAIFRGYAKHHPAVQNWQDDAYLREKFGNYTIKWEPKKENRTHSYCGQSFDWGTVDCEGDGHAMYLKHGKEKFIRMDEFLDNYQDPKYDVYLIGQMPDKMAAELLVEPTFECAPRQEELAAQENGPFRSQPHLSSMYETNFWMSFNEADNFSQSVVHYDMGQQIMCQVAGKKEWMFFDTVTEKDKIPMWGGNYDIRNPNPKCVT